MNRSPVGPSAGSASRSAQVPLSSLYGPGCINAKLMDIQDRNFKKYSVLIITREIETRQGVQIKTEYYAADFSRRSAPGSAEEQRGNPMRKDISDSIAAFGDKYAMDERELLTEHVLSFSKNPFRRVGFGPDGVNGIGVHYLVRPITLLSYPESIVVKVIIASRPYPITIFQKWMMRESIECEQVLSNDGVHKHKRSAFLRFESEQRMTRAPLDLSPNDSTLALRGDFVQPFPENQVGSSREVRALSDPLPVFFEEIEEGDHLPEGEQRDRALSLLSPEFMEMLCPENGQQSEPPQGFVDWLNREFPVDEDEENVIRGSE
jgi:hypothetical protein